MKYCKKCLTTDLRPNSSFNENSICIACEFNKSNKNENFLNRLAFLKKMVRLNKSKRKTHKLYDCIVGVSAGKDSTRQAHWVRDRLGLNPLLVCCGYPPLQMTDIGALNMANLISMGFDIEIFTPAPQSSAKLSLSSFNKFGNVCKSTEMALFSAVPRIAISKKIPLIFWGENPALQLGDSKVEGVNYFDGNNLRNMNTLTEGGVDWIFDEVESYKANAYKYPDNTIFEKSGTDIMYLGPAWDDWSSDDNSIYAALNGLTLRPGDAKITGDISGASMLDEEFTNINMMIKYFKYGFGRATDICNERIRNGTISRGEAIKIVEMYDGVCDDSIIDKYCHYVDISINQFWRIVNKYTNSKLFFIANGKRPERKFEVGIDYDD